MKVEVTVTDQPVDKPALTRTVAVTSADGTNASIRHEPINMPGVTLSLDASPMLADQGRIRLRVAIDFMSGETGAAGPGRHQVRARQDLLLTSGVPVVISESSDPISGRAVKVEVKATVLK